MQYEDGKGPFAATRISRVSWLSLGKVQMGLLLKKQTISVKGFHLLLLFSAKWSLFKPFARFTYL